MLSWEGYLWFILLAGGGTFCLRALFVVFLNRMDLPHGIESLLRYIPASVLTAIVTPAIFLHQGTVPYLFGKERILAALAAALVAAKTKNILATLASGMAVLYLLKALA